MLNDQTQREVDGRTVTAFFSASSAPKIPVKTPPEPGKKRPPVEPPKRSPKPSPVIDPPVHPDPGKKPSDDPAPIGDPPKETEKPIKA